MRKDFNKKDYASHRIASGNRRRQFLMVGIIAAISSVVGLGVYQYKKDPERFAALSTCYVKLTNWVAERKNHLNQSITKVKQLADKNDADQEIHFEFYTALPNMKMSAPTAPVETVAAVKPPVEKKPTPIVAEAPKPAVFNAADLERQMADEFSKQSTYVIQLGVFRSAASAQKYRDALIDAGFKAAIMKTAMDEREAYRVQVGPFTNKNQAALTQRQLQKRGLTGIVRKIEKS